MADLRRRRRRVANSETNEESGSSDAEVEEVKLSDTESVGEEPVPAAQVDSEYESVDEEGGEIQENPDHPPDVEGGTEAIADVVADDSLEDEEIPDDDDEECLENERQEGDGEESQDTEEKPLDDDEDRRNPQYIPKKGAFYEHDDRAAEEEIKKEAEDPKKPRKLWKDEGKWGHDKFSEREQEPKSRDELVAIYGYDIRNEEGPPRARRRRRYGRGPNKYTRNWEDEDAYNKANERNGDGPEPVRGRGGRGGPRRGGGGGRGRGFYGNADDRNRAFPNRGDKEIFDDEFPAIGANNNNSVNNRSYNNEVSKTKETLIIENNNNKNEGKFGKNQTEQKLENATPKAQTFERRSLSPKQKDDFHISKSVESISTLKKSNTEPLSPQRRNSDICFSSKVDPFSPPRQNEKETQTESRFPNRGGRGGGGARRGQFVEQPQGRRQQREDPLSKHMADLSIGDSRDVPMRNTARESRDVPLGDGPMRDTARESRDVPLGDAPMRNTARETRDVPLRSKYGPPRSGKGESSNRGGPSSWSDRENRQSTIPPRLQEAAANRPKRYSTQRQRTGPDAPAYQGMLPSQAENTGTYQSTVPDNTAGYQGVIPSPPLAPVSQPFFDPGFQQPMYADPAQGSPPQGPPYQGYNQSYPEHYAMRPMPPSSRMFNQVTLTGGGQPVMPAPYIGSNGNMMNYGPPPATGSLPVIPFPQTFSSHPPPPPATPPQEIYRGGVTYYNTVAQLQPAHIHQKRPKAAIPIVPPPDVHGIAQNQSTTQIYEFKDTRQEENLADNLD